MSTTGEFPAPIQARMKLIVVDGPMRGLEAPLGGDPVVVGSDLSAHLRLPLDPGVGSFHCQVQQDGQRCWVEDLGSSSRTQVIGKPGSNRIPLVAGDILLVGATRLVVAADGTDRIQLLAGLDRVAEAAAAVPSGSQPNVLLVDDDVDFLLYVQMLLQSAGYTIRSASNGVEALIRIQEQAPDVIVCDVQMPEMDGFSLIKRLRHRPGMELVPLIILTGLDFEGITERGLSLGADDCLNKDRIRELEPRIRRALERRAHLESAIDLAHRDGESQSTPGMAGNLEQVPVPSLLAFLGMERKSGVLVLRHGADRTTARLLLRDGAIVSARMGGTRPESRNAEAVYQLFDWGDGTFDFTPGSVEIDDEVRLDINHLLMEAALRHDQEAPDEEAPVA